MTDQELIKQLAEALGTLLWISKNHSENHRCMAVADEFERDAHYKARLALRAYDERNSKWGF